MLVFDTAGPLLWKVGGKTNKGITYVDHFVSTDNLTVTGDNVTIELKARIKDVFNKLDAITFGTAVKFPILSKSLSIVVAVESTRSSFVVTANSPVKAAS